jgi:Raf kinase inhibitor-like YbhB/YbcL family protein
MSKNKLCTLVVVVGVLVLIWGLSRHLASPMPKPPSSNAAKAVTMVLTSPAFDDGGMIPTVYTCDGDQTSPPLAISGVPESAKSLVLIVDDPATPIGVFVHWIVYDIDPKTRVVEESMPGTSITFGTSGSNSVGDAGYAGPCPPSGTHHYIFTLYALDAKLAMKPGASKSDVLDAMEGHIIEETQLVGLYQRVNK